MAGMIEEAYPLTPLQQGMLFHSLSRSQPAVDVTQIQCRLHEPLDPSAFEGAWQKICERHPILRTTFHWQDSQDPVQKVHHGLRIPVQQKDWRKMPETEQENRLLELAQSERQRPFEVSAPSSDALAVNSAG